MSILIPARAPGSIWPHQLRGAEIAVSEANRDLDTALTARRRIDGLPDKGQVVQPAAPGADACQAGTRCVVSERTIFCRAFEQVKAVLGQPIGSQRRKVLTSLKSQGACLVLDVGQAVLVQGPRREVTRPGEGPVSVVAATADGQGGYVLASALAADQTASR